MVSEIRSATASMTSVPKPLKFLRPHYAALKARFETVPRGSAASPLLADVLSVLATTVSAGPEGSGRESLKYRLLGHTASLGDWGHEYMRHLAGEIAEEFKVGRGGGGAGVGAVGRGRLGWVGRGMRGRREHATREEVGERLRHAGLQAAPRQPLSADAWPRLPRRVCPQPHDDILTAPPPS